jgi:septum formation protein
MNPADKPQLILASASPRRQRLLREMGLTFSVEPPRGVQELREGMRPQLLVVENARRKAAAVAARHPRSLVIGADTEVVLAGKIFGKPRDLEEAAMMLGELAGRAHQVWSGVCLMRAETGTELSFSECTTVWMRPLTEEQIRQYLAKIDPLDKAGAYAIQEHGEGVVERIEGNFSTVVGLPVERLRVELERLGLWPVAG